MEVVEAPDYSLPDDEDLYQAPVKNKPKRKKRGLKKKDKEALGLSTGRRTTRGPQPAPPPVKPRSLFFAFAQPCVPLLTLALQVGHAAECRTELPARRSEADGCVCTGIFV